MPSAAKSDSARPGGNGYLRVLQITDTHLYANPEGRLAGLVTQQSYSAVLAKVMAQAWPADLVLATGDIVHDGSEIGYRRFKDQFEELGVRTLVIPGNHDKPEVMRRVFQHGQVTADGHAALGNWQFVMLDSTRAGHDGGRLAEDQLELLDRALASDRERHALVCLHHHPVSVDCQWIDNIGVANADDFFAIIDRYPQVRAVVWGHIHQDYSGERRGVRLLASPSTCIQFKPRQDEFGLDDQPPGFRWLHLYDDGRIETAVERIEQGASDVDLLCSGYE